MKCYSFLDQLGDISGHSYHLLTVHKKHCYNWDWIVSTFTSCHVTEGGRWIRSSQKVATAFQHGFWWYAIRLAATLITEVTLKLNGLASAQSSEGPTQACALALRTPKRTLSQFPQCEAHSSSGPFAPSLPRPPLSKAQCHGNAKWQRWRHTRM